jgi:thioredoxin 1
MSMPTDVTDATFAQFLKQHPNVVLDAWAEWCPPCKKLDPVLRELAAEYGDQVAIAKLNTDENEQTAMRYGIMSLPTILVFRNGERIDQMVGMQPKESLRARLDKSFGL